MHVQSPGLDFWCGLDSTPGFCCAVGLVWWQCQGKPLGILKTPTERKANVIQTSISDKSILLSGPTSHSSGSQPKPPSPFTPWFFHPLIQFLEESQNVPRPDGMSNSSNVFLRPTPSSPCIWTQAQDLHLDESRKNHKSLRFFSGSLMSKAIQLSTMIQYLILRYFFYL